MTSQINTLEECYEYMLSFAARGLPAERGSQIDVELRDFLGRAVEALYSLKSACAILITEGKLEPAEKYEAFFSVMIDDAKRAAAAIEMVLVQPAISSQLIDNLNASMHLRAVLTDLFLVAELKTVEPQIKEGLSVYR